MEPQRDPVESDLADTAAADVSQSRRGARSRGALTPVVVVVSAGGALGAGARYAATMAWPTPQAAFPATVFLVNVVGSALIGILMVSVVQLWPHRRLARPFLGTGLLGGFTTFSTYAVDVSQLATARQVGTAAAYLILTPTVAVLAATLAARMTRRLITRRSA
ncbi:MAG: CrcB family protein [Dermatophilaceae bacterium]